MAGSLSLGILISNVGRMGFWGILYYVVIIRTPKIV